MDNYEEVIEEQKKKINEIKDQIERISRNNSSAHLNPFIKMSNTDTFNKRFKTNNVTFGNSSLDINSLREENIYLKQQLKKKQELLDEYNKITKDAIVRLGDLFKFEKKIVKENTQLKRKINPDDANQNEVDDMNDLSSGLRSLQQRIINLENRVGGGNGGNNYNLYKNYGNDFSYHKMNYGSLNTSPSFGNFKHSYKDFGKNLRIDNIGNYFNDPVPNNYYNNTYINPNQKILENSNKSTYTFYGNYC